jgi:urease alpha subunit
MVCHHLDSAIAETCIRRRRIRETIAAEDIPHDLARSR